MTLQPRTSIRTSRSAFSLVEVLVSIGILALLLGLLLPTLTKVRKQAMTIRCQSNMRQLMVMTSLFCNEHDGVLPYTNWGDGYLWSPHRSHGVAGWAYDGDVPGNRGSFAESDVTSSVLWKYLASGTGSGSGREVFRCPLDVGPYNPQWYAIITTYCANGSMSGFGGVPRNLSEFNAGGAAMYWEVGCTAGGGEGWDGANFPWEGISVRHSGNSTTVGFLDGHVTLYDEDKFNEELNRGPSTLWCDPRSATGGWNGSPVKVAAIRDN